MKNKKFSDRKEVFDKDYEILDVTLKLYPAYPDFKPTFKMSLLNPLDIEMIDEIISVKRLPDGEVFRVDDYVNHKGEKINGRIWRISEKIDCIWIHFGEASVSPLNSIQKSHKPEKDYEVLTEREIKTGKIKVISDWSRYCKEIWEIHSVKRLSDGEVFSVRDGVEYNCGTNHFYGTIKGFKETHNGIIVSYGDSENFLNNIEKRKRTPILTTEDGVELFEGDKRWWVNEDGICDYGEGLAYDTDIMRDCKYFSTYEAAEEYRLNNARLLSYNDVEKQFATVYIEDGLESLINLVKSRLK